MNFVWILYDYNRQICRTVSPYSIHTPNHYVIHRELFSFWFSQCDQWSSTNDKYFLNFLMKKQSLNQSYNLQEMTWNTYFNWKGILNQIRVFDPWVISLFTFIGKWSHSEWMGIHTSPYSNEGADTNSKFKKLTHQQWRNSHKLEQTHSDSEIQELDEQVDCKDHDFQWASLLLCVITMTALMVKVQLPVLNTIYIPKVPKSISLSLLSGFQRFLFSL